MSSTALRVANSVDPDQTPHYVASDLGKNCLLRLVSPNTNGEYMVFAQSEIQPVSCLLHAHFPVSCKLICFKVLCRSYKSLSFSKKNLFSTPRSCPAGRVSALHPGG